MSISSSINSKFPETEIECSDFQVKNEKNLDKKNRQIEGAIKENLFVIHFVIFFRNGQSWEEWSLVTEKESQ